MMSGLIERSDSTAGDRAENPVHMTGSEPSSSEHEVVSRREESPGMTMAGMVVTKSGFTGLAVDEIGPELGLQTPPSRR
jgi:hypothetical protein